MSKNFFDEFKTSFNGLNLTYGEVGKKYGDVFDLADAFLCIDSMTHKKLQKLCYYAKAWSDKKTSAVTVNSHIPDI